MPDYSDIPSSFMAGMGGSQYQRESYSNPFYSIPHKYMPNSIDQMLWWSNHFLFRFGFYRAVLFRVASYFVTSLSIECEDSEAKKKYEETFEDLHWKNTLTIGGLNLLAYGNLFTTINQGFTRFIGCPNCKKISSLDKIDDYEFTPQAQFIYKCPGCGIKGVHEIIDKPSKDVNKVHVKFWNAREVICRTEETTGDVEYFWRIPAEYKKSILTPNNKFYSKKTPKVMYDAVLQDKLLAFNDKNFLHLQVPTPNGIKLDGKSVPFCIYLFDDFFMLQVLRRFNEAICFEDIAPFRVISMSPDQNAQANPILMQGGGNWKAAVEQMLKDHRRDPGSHHTFPFPLQYQQLGGDGKNLAPTELIQQAIGNILNALYVPQELYTMTLQAQAVGPALRLFENSWAILIDAYNNLLNHWGEVIGKIKGLPKAKISLIPTTLSDDMERKSVIGQLVSANAIARSELLSLYGLDYKDQLRKKKQEEREQKEIDDEEKIKDQLQQAGESGGSNGPSSPSDVLSQADEIAQQLFPMEGAERRTELQKLKAQDQTLYGAVKQKLDELTSGAKSQGVQQSKQQAQQGSQGGGQ